MKLSRIRRALSAWLAPSPMASRKTHTAYAEAFHNADGTYTGRVYSYEGSGVVLEEFAGSGGRPAAAQQIRRLMRKYRREA